VGNRHADWAGDKHAVADHLLGAPPIPSLFSTLTLPDDGMKCDGRDAPDFESADVLFSSMNVRENGGTYFPPYPVMLEPITWKRQDVCSGAMGAGWKYLASIVGRRGISRSRPERCRP